MYNYVYLLRCNFNVGNHDFWYCQFFAIVYILCRNFTAEGVISLWNLCPILLYLNNKICSNQIHNCHTPCDMNQCHTWNAWLSSFWVIRASTLLKWRRLMWRARMRCRLYSFKFSERIFWNFSSGLIWSGSGCTINKTFYWSNTLL